MLSKAYHLGQDIQADNTLACHSADFRDVNTWKNTSREPGSSGSQELEMEDRLAAKDSVKNSRAREEARRGWERSWRCRINKT